MVEFRKFSIQGRMEWRGWGQNVYVRNIVHMHTLKSVVMLLCIITNEFARYCNSIGQYLAYVNNHYEPTNNS